MKTLVKATIDGTIAAALLAMAFLIGAPAALAQRAELAERMGPIFYVPEESVGVPSNVVADNAPPVVKWVKIAPEWPGPADEIVVTAEFRNDNRNTQSEPMEAHVLWSLDEGATWKKTEMEKAANARYEWTATLPPRGENGDIRYFFTVEDTAGNMLVEMPESRIDWSALKPESLAAVMLDDNENFSAASKDLDLLEVRMGADAERFYFALRVEGAISNGSISPFEPYIYAMGVSYPWEIASNQGVSDLLFMHSPLAPFVQFSETALLDVDNDLAEIYAGKPLARAQGDWLLTSFRKDAIERVPFDRLRMVFGAAYGTSYHPLSIRMVDVTHYVDIQHSDRRIQIGPRLTDKTIAGETVLASLDR